MTKAESLEAMALVLVESRRKLLEASIESAIKRGLITTRQDEWWVWNRVFDLEERR